MSAFFTIDGTNNEEVTTALAKIQANFSALSSAVGLDSSGNVLSRSSYDPRKYGCKWDGKALTDVTTSSAGGPISSASYAFVRTDVGKLITIAGAGAAAAVLNTSIKSVKNGQATLVTAPSTTIAGTGAATFGTDDTAAMTALVVLVNAAGGGMISAPAGISIISSVIWLSNVSLFGQGVGSTIFKHIMTTDAIVSMIYNNVGGAANISNCQFENFQMDMEAATASGGYQVLASCIRILQPKNNYVTNCYLHGSPATCLALDYGVNTVVSNNIIANYGRLATAASLGGAGLGCALNATAAWTVTGNIFVSPTTANSTYGCFFEAETANTAEGVANVTGNVFMGTGTLGAIGDCGLRRFICVGNHIVVPAGGANTGDGIVVKGGTVGQFAGLRGLIADNIITLAVNGITVDYTLGIDGGQYSGYVIRGNRIQACTGHGIKITASATVLMSALAIDGNFLDSNKFCGISFQGAGGFADLDIRNNTCLNNCANGAAITTAAIAFITGAVARLTMVGNSCYDNNAGAQKFALGVGASTAVTGAFITNNNFANNATQALDIVAGGTIAGSIRENGGYNPVGAASVSPGVSPYTYTAGNSPETLYVAASTSITAMTQDGSSILPIATAANGQIAVSLDPGSVLVVTYTGVLTAAKYIH